ncbi:MAG: SH3 domain-containing protein [Roseiflexus sp.]|nr:SH3 domain-containing protein [Roseiflexus sp.]
MSPFSPIVTVSGSPLIIIALLLSAVVLLELERIWTRTRRFAGKPVGAPAFVLDGLAIAAALFAFVGCAVALMQIMIEAASYMFERTTGLVGQIDGTTAGLAIGSLIALLVSMIVIRHLSSRVAAPSREPMRPEIVPEGRIIRPEPAPPIAGALPVLSGNVAESEEEPPLVMLRTRRPSQRPVPHPVQMPTVEQMLTPPQPKPRRLQRIVVMAATLLVVGATGFVYRDAIIQTVAAWQLPITSRPISEPPEDVVSPTTLPATPQVDVQAAPTAAPQIWSVAVERLNLRAGPGIDYPVVTTLKRGDDVIDLGETAGSGEDRWVRVRAGTQEGWVFRTFLR